VALKDNGWILIAAAAAVDERMNSRLEIVIVSLN
jgi:hypothetical protein